MRLLITILDPPRAKSPAVLRDAARWFRPLFLHNREGLCSNVLAVNVGVYPTLSDA